MADPSKSRLLLKDWKSNPLTVGDIRRTWIRQSSPFLAYLSARSTSANDGKSLTDEVIHMVSAFQLSGFRHVVGTLWKVSDPHCAEVFQVLYETLRDEGMTDDAVARGLHRALRQLRDGVVSNDRIRTTSQTDVAATGMTRGREGREGDSEDRIPTARLPRSAMANYDWIPYIHFGG